MAYERANGREPTDISQRGLYGAGAGDERLVVIRDMGGWAGSIHRRTPQVGRR